MSFSLKVKSDFWCSTINGKSREAPQEDQVMTTFFLHLHPQLGSWSCVWAWSGFWWHLFFISTAVNLARELQVTIWDTQDQRLTRVVMPTMAICSPGFLSQGFLSPRPTCFSSPGFYCAALYSLAPTTSRNPPFPVSDTPLAAIDVVENDACITLGLPPYQVEFEGPPFDVYIFDPTTNSTSIEIYRNITRVPTRDEYYPIFFNPKVRVSHEFDPRPDNRFNYVSLTITPQLYIDADGVGDRSYLATTSTRHHPPLQQHRRNMADYALGCAVPAWVFFETVRQERTSLWQTSAQRDQVRWYCELRCLNDFDSHLVHHHRDQPLHRLLLQEKAGSTCTARL